jgi:hypothetical protein
LPLGACLLDIALWILPFGPMLIEKKRPCRFTAKAVKARKDVA